MKHLSVPIYIALFCCVLFSHPGFGQIRIYGPGGGTLFGNKNKKPGQQNEAADPPRNSNTLSDDEKNDGWQLLFDGKTMTGWHTYNKTFNDGKWEVNDGTLHLLDRDPSSLSTCHDLATDESYGDFDLKAEWKVSAHANSGIMLHVQEGSYPMPYQTGPEMQVLDNQGNSNGQLPAGRAGSLFGLIPCTPDNAKPPGQWNQVEIICQAGVLKFFQNGVNVVTTTLWDDSWNRLVAPVTSTKWPDYGVFRSGKIDLQDMAGEVWFTDIKIKRLSGAAPAPAPAQGSDLSGVWEGQQTNGALIMYYEVGLVKTGDNTYAGFDSCRWVKYANAPLNVKGQPPHAKKVFIARFDQGVLTCTEVGNMQNSNWGVSSELFKLVNNNGTDRLVNASPNQPDRHFDLRRSGQPFPPEYAPYLVSDSTLQIQNISFVNSHNQPDLRFNDRGRLIISVSNSSLMNLSGISARIVTAADETDNGIQGYDPQNHKEVTVPKSARTDLSIPVVTNFSVPQGPLHMTITLFSGDKVFAQKDVVVNTEAFFRTSKVVLPEAANPRIKAIGGYYGISGTPYALVTAPLAAPALAGDKLAQMWKAVFMYKGNGGYKVDESQATATAKQALERVESAAREGDAEALYLMFYACQLGLEGRGASASAEHFLEMSADAGFKPAIYDEGVVALRTKNYERAFSCFVQSFNLGVRKAASNIGTLYEGGNGVGKDADSAYAWYQKGVAFGDPAAMVNLAMLYSTGFGDTPPDINKALTLATRAADENYPAAMMFAGNVYLNGKQGKAQDIPLAIKWFKRAADLGDAGGMLHLGVAYLADNVPGVPKDEASGLFWIKRSAELGNPGAMKILSRMYYEGMATDKNVIKARYWYNQAVQLGAAQMERKDIEAAQDDANNFWANADFSPSYVYVNSYNEVVGDSGPDFFGGMIGGLLGSFMQRYANMQEQINGLEFIQQKNGYRIYGGTVSSYCLSSLNLKQGETVSIKAYGIISTGMMSGSANADGLGDAWAEYRIVPTIPCSAVMAQIKGGNWQFVGQRASFTATSDGPLVFAINGIDARQYKGYFDLVIEDPVN